MKVLRPFVKIEKNIKSNLLIEREIKKAFQTRNIEKIDEFLSDKGLFFGFNKTIYIAKLQRIFNKYENCSCKYIFGTSTGISIGNKVHEFIYTKEDERMFDEHIVISSMSFDQLKLGRKLQKNQYRLQMIFIIDGSEVVKIIKPTGYINLIEINKARKEN